MDLVYRHIAVCVHEGSVVRPSQDSVNVLFYPTLPDFRKKKALFFGRFSVFTHNMKECEWSIGRMIRPDENRGPRNKKIYP